MASTKRRGGRTRKTGAARSGQLRTKRAAASGYARRASSGEAKRTRAQIDQAVARGEKLRSAIEQKISRLLTSDEQ